MRGFPEETYWYVGLLVLFILVIPPYLWRLGGGMMADGQALQQDGVTIAGEITGTSREYRQHPGDYVHYVHYLFQLDGQRFEGRDIAESGVWLEYQGRAGVAIDVTYLPRDPSVSAIFEPDDRAYGGQIARAVGLSLAALAVWGLALVLRSGFRARRTGRQ